MITLEEVVRKAFEQLKEEDSHALNLLIHDDDPTIRHLIAAIILSSRAKNEAQWKELDERLSAMEKNIGRHIDQLVSPQRLLTLFSIGVVTGIIIALILKGLA